MKKTIMSAVMVALAAVGRAQMLPQTQENTNPAAASAVSAPLLAADASASPEAVTTAAAGGVSADARSEWLPSFSAVEVSAPLDIRFVRVPDTEAPKIVYDTKGSYTTKFRAEVKDGVLHVRERADSRRPDRTGVVVYYNDLQRVAIEDATAVFEGRLCGTMLDLRVGGEARVTAELDLKDLEMEQTGHSSVGFTGSVRYLSLYVSTGVFDAPGLECMSAEINAQSGGRATLAVTDRLEGRASTGGTIRYKGTPGILRVAQKFMAGDIKPFEESR